MTLDDLERAKTDSCIKKTFCGVHQKIWIKMVPYYQRQNVGWWF